MAPLEAGLRASQAKRWTLWANGTGRVVIHPQHLLEG